MTDGNPLPPPGCGRGNRTPLIRMLNVRAGVRTLCQLDEQLSCMPDADHPMPLSHLDHRARHRWGGGQPIEHPIVGHVAIEAYAALFGGKALPGKSLWKGSQRFLLATVSGTFVGRAMDSHVSTFTPGMGLTIEIIEIAEADSRPIAVFEKAH